MEKALKQTGENRIQIQIKLRRFSPLLLPVRILNLFFNGNNKFLGNKDIRAILTLASKITISFLSDTFFNFTKTFSFDNFTS
jgi:hypothetical protein